MGGRFGNMKFMDYMIAGNIQSFNYTPEDIFWGQLAGCRESIHAGVTTVVDHAHMTYSPEHGTSFSHYKTRCDRSPDWPADLS
jgi:hypothetical protein